MTQAKLGNTVKVHYEGILEDGTIFDSSWEREPLEFTLGEGMLLPGFEKAIIGLSIDESKTILLDPVDAYGEYDTKQIVTVDRSDIPANVELELGMVLQVTGEDGQAFNVMLTEINDETITLDGNHPLAGESLTFKIKLIEIL